MVWQLIWQLTESRRLWQHPIRCTRIQIPLKVLCLHDMIIGGLSISGISFGSIYFRRHCKFFLLSDTCKTSWRCFTKVSCFRVSFKLFGFFKKSMKAHTMLSDSVYFSGVEILMSSTIHLLWLMIWMIMRSNWCSTLIYCYVLTL